MYVTDAEERRPESLSYARRKKFKPVCILKRLHIIHQLMNDMQLPDISTCKTAFMTCLET
jgi:hypothetical protein